MPDFGYLTPTKDGKRNLPAGYFIDLATWQRINMLYTSKAMTDLGKSATKRGGANWSNG